MEINVKDFKDVLNNLNISFNKKPLMEYQTFLKIDNGYLTISDNNSALFTKIDCEEELQCLLPFETLKNLFDKFKENIATLTIKDNRANLKCGRSNTKINLGDFSKYPNLQPKEIENSVVLRGEFLKNVIDKCSFACGVETKKEILKGINIKCEKGLLQFTSTDSYKLAYYSVDVEGIADFNFTIHKNDIIKVAKLIKPEDNVEIKYNDNTAVFHIGNYIYQSRILDGEYPDVRRIFPRNYNCRFEINRNNFIDALELINTIAKNEIDKKTKSLSSPIIMKTEGNNLRISCESQSLGFSENEVELDNIDGNIPIVACSLTILLEEVKNIDNQTIIVEFAEARRPILIKGNDSNFKQIVLPIAID